MCSVTISSKILKKKALSSSMDNKVKEFLLKIIERVKSFQEDFGSHF